MGSANDQEVKVGLTIEEQGEPAAFDAAAQSITALSEQTADAVPSINSLARELVSLTNTAQGTQAARSAVADFARSLTDLASAGSLEEERDAVDSALEAWKRLGSEIPDVLEKSDEAAKNFQETLERLEERQKNLGDPLISSFEKADEAVTKLGEAIEKNGSAGVKTFAKVQQQIDAYRRSLEEARAAGGNVTGDQVAQLTRLEGEYAKAERSVANFSAAKKEAARSLESTRAAITGEIKNVNSLTDVLEQAVPTWSRYVDAAYAVVGAFEAGWAAGTKLRSVMNQLTDGNFDKVVSQWAKLHELSDFIVNGFENVAGSMEGVDKQTELLTNQFKAFRKLGLEGFSQDVEKNARILNDFKRAGHDAAAELATFENRLHLNEAELEKSALAVAKNAAAFAEQNKQLSKAQLGKDFKGVIQPLLDDYERLGKQAPEALRKVAEAWKISTSTAEAAANRQKAAVSSILQQITGVALKSKEELAQSARDLELAFSHIKISGLNFEQFQRAREQVQQVIDAYTLAGERIPPSLQKIAQEVQVFQSEADLMTAKVNNAATGLDKFRESNEKAGQAAGAAAGNVDQLAASSEKAASAADKATEAGVRSKTVIEERFDFMTGKYVPVITQVAVAEEAGAVATDKATEAGVRSKTVIEGQAKANIEAAGSSKKAAEETAGDAKEKDLLVEVLKRLQETMERINTTLAAEQGAFAEMRKSVAEVPPEVAKVGGALELLQNIAKALDFSGIFSSLLSDLDQVQSKAAATATAIGAVAGGAAGAVGSNG